MVRYKLVSFDMFQTLVDVETKKYEVMSYILGSKYTIEIANQLWEDANYYIYVYFHRANVENEKFNTILDIFTDCYKDLFPKYDIDMNPRNGAMVLAKKHNEASFYPETKNMFRDIKSKYKTCLISDADLIMIDDLLNQFEFDRVYLSEINKEYKSNIRGSMFRSAIKEFGIHPEEMVHIGDGYNDIVGAKIVGANAIWVNRNNRKWIHSITPDQIVNDLSEIKLG